MRVDIAHLDNLLNLVGELVINRTSQEQYLERLGRTVSELLLSVDRLRRVGFHLESRYEVAELLRGEQQRGAVVPPRWEDGVLRPFAPSEQGGRVADEFDDLEMDRYTELHQISRELVEIAADINAAGGELEGLHDNIEQTLTRQGRIATDLQDRMMEVRLVPIGTIASRLYRAVRGVAAKRGRAAELVVEGEKTEIDKILLEELTDPLLHLVRNAADHGIESSAERAVRGKPATGTIRLSAAREGNEAVIRVSDDGAGIDVDAVLEKAVARGMVRSREAINREAVARSNLSAGLQHQCHGQRHLRARRGPGRRPHQRHPAERHAGRRLDAGRWHHLHHPAAHHARGDARLAGALRRADVRHSAAGRRSGRLLPARTGQPDRRQ